MNEIQTARESLRRASYDPRKLVLIHVGLTSLLTLLLAVIDCVLEQSIGSTGGLSGMGTRAVLNTARTVLSYLQMIILPFWNAGYLFSTILLARNETARPESLLQGFRSWRPVLTVTLLTSLIYSGLTVAVFLATLQLLTFTPLINPAAQLLLPYIDSATTVAGTMESMDVATAMAIVWALLPLILIAVAITGLAVFYFSYRYRLALFRAMDDPEKGGRAAMWVSRCMMRGRKKALFLLDLRFWWYYLLSALLSLLPLGDVILPAFGITLPENSYVTYFIFLSVYLVCQLLLALAARYTVSVSYAVFYDRLAAELNQDPKGGVL